MTINETLNYIHSLNKFGIKPGLERITALLQALGNPQEKLRCVHVAGTNGKGSVCSMLSNIFIANGQKTGLFISPYVICFNERMQINGQYITNEQLAKLCTAVKPVAEQVGNSLGDSVTEFEFITAVAFLWFAQSGTDIVVLETGLGGRLDSTNVIKTNQAAVITKINLDHTAVLGNTIEKIAAEKCGIIKAGSAVISSDEQFFSAAEVIRQTAEKHKNPLIIAKAKAAQNVQQTATKTTFDYAALHITLNMPGTHQIYNATQCIETALYLKVKPQAIVQGIANTRFPCRLEVLDEKLPLIIDGAHNPDGAETLAQYLKQHRLNPVAIVGMMADKDCENVLKTVLPHCRAAITVAVASNPRSMGAEKLANLAKPYCPIVTASNSYSAAVETAFSQAAQNGAAVLVFGSLYLASDVRPLLLKHLGENPTK